MTTLTPSGTLRRVRFEVTGLVQGVGFRPFVYRTATELGLGGFVANTSTGVTIEVEGWTETLEEFRRRLQEDAPVLARIDSCRAVECAATGEHTFRIVASSHDGRAETLISPDVATCDDCLRELFDPNDRRYRYPFINCTNCGPRYTIVESIPYDRPLTSMKIFPMCPDCEREYHDPADRRFHAQPNACPRCGPRLVLHDGESVVEVSDPIEEVVAALRNGRIVAVRGIGGFHLVVDATNEAAVRELRRRKRREEKPLAVMSPDIESVRKFCELSPDEERLLHEHTRPIVLLRQKEGHPIAPSVALESRYFGVMLPYTPLHHLLLRGNFLALVMTSGNLSEEPIAIGNDEALARLKGIADLFLLHDREILQRVDDSIVRMSAGARRVIRRARGFVPHPLQLPQETAKVVLACGGELKNTIALTHGKNVFLSQHIGDLDNPLALSFYRETIKHLQRILDIEPELIAYDIHPEYLSTKYAQELEGLPKVAVQHHHAHLASVMAENGVSKRVLGIILDGTGYGTDGTIWGGELLVGDFESFERLVWLEPVPMPGGTAAIKNPWRMALSYLYHTFGDRFLGWDLPPISHIAPEQREVLLHAIDKRINCPLTSSCGRLFDGIASLLGLCHEAAYEAQAAIRLEMLASTAGAPTTLSEPSKVMDVTLGALPLRPIIEKTVIAIIKGEPREETAFAFHTDLATLWVSAAIAAREKTGVNRVALSGGVYQNDVFLRLMVHRLQKEGFSVLTHREIPTNDGGLAVGQAVIADTVYRLRCKTGEIADVSGGAG
jgi:hydrogenase maturation protein HypF